ncbi:MAG: hypothetical protein WBC91_10660 [Phototrophicaceae bacterium]
MKRLLIIPILIMILAACAETGVSLTSEANYAFAGTQVADLRVTATVQAARAETTLDFMGTRSARAAAQSSFFEETLVATGFAPDLLATQRQQALGGASPTPQPSATPLVTVEDGSSSGVTPVAGQTLTPTPPAVTINAPNAAVNPPTSAVQIQATPDLGGLILGNVLTATGAGDDGCGSGVTSIFGMNTTEIYVIIPTFNITANTYTLAARWQRAGQAIGPVYDFTPLADSEQLCIWFFVDNTDFPFEAGNYSVTIDVNGQAVSGPIPFVIQ